jgi:hypothetical protein
VAKSSVRSGECSAGAGQDVGEDQPPLGVRVADLDGQALAAVERTSPGRKASAETAFSTAATSTTRRTFRLCGHHQPPERQRMGRAAHVLLHVAHPGGGLEIQTSGVEHHPLADEGDQRQVGPVEVPADLDHARLPVRGRGAADGVDGRIVVLEQGRRPL